MTQFDDTTLQRLFGSEAAEDETPSRFKEYFFRNRAFDSVQADLPIRILVGHKGIGKSALLRMSYLDALDDKIISLWLRPNDVLGSLKSRPTNFLSLIEEWKDGLQKLIFREAIGSVCDEFDVNSWIKRTSRSLTEALAGFLNDSAHRVLKPGCDIYVRNYLTTRRLRVYLDDLDRGWEGRPEDTHLISALLNAIRDMANNYGGLQFRLGLRSDVYYLVRTSDESTDKIEGYVTWLSWENHEVLTLLAKRIETFFGRTVDEKELVKQPQHLLAKYLDPIMESRFQGVGKWHRAPIHRVLMSLIRRRPRDLVKLCYAAGRHAYQEDRGVIMTSDFQAVFEGYSQERLQDIVNEFKTELPNVGALLFGMKPARRQRKTADSFQYTNDELIVKIKNVKEHARLEFTNRRPVSPRELAQFMYKIDFITARRTHDGGRIERKYFDQSRYLQNQFIEFGYDWEVHPAYRWALQPGDVSDIFKEIDLSA